MAFIPTVPMYTRFELASGDISTLAGQVYEQAQNENPGISVVVRQAVASDWGYTSANAVFSIPAGPGWQTVTIASGTVSTGSVLAPFGVVLTTAIPSGVTLGYMDVYVGGVRVARWDLSLLNRAVSGSDASILYIPAEYSIIITQTQSYSVQLIAYNSNTVAVNLGIQLLGLVGEPNGKVISIRV